MSEISLTFKEKPMEKSITKINGSSVGITEYGYVYTTIYIDPIIVNGVTYKAFNLRTQVGYDRVKPKLHDRIEIIPGNFISDYINLDIRNTDKTHTPITRPILCPMCQCYLSPSLTGSSLRCVNTKCDRIMLRQVYNIVRLCLQCPEIKFFNIVNLYNLGLIKDITSIFKLDKDKLEKGSIKPSIAERLVRNISNRIEVPLQYLYHALEPNFQLSVALKLASVKDESEEWYQPIKKLTYSFFVNTDNTDVLEKHKESLNSILKKNLDLFKELDKYISVKLITKKLPLGNKTFIINKAPKLRQTFLKTLIGLNGGSVMLGKSNIKWIKIDYIVNNDEESVNEELQRGVDFGVDVIAEDDILKRIKFETEIENMYERSEDD